MERQSKEIIASKGQLVFYKECYAQYGYKAEKEYRNKHHLHYTLHLYREGEVMSEMQKERLRLMEEKLRIIEVIDQKKRRFFTLFFNLFIHAVIFSVQAVLFSWLELSGAYPSVMLRVGVIAIQIILIYGFCEKLWEWLRWNIVQKSLKREILSIGAEKSAYVGDEKTCFISVLFTRGSGKTSTLLYWLTGRQYTHVSLGLGTQTECFYSFNFRGFRAEHPAHRKLKNGKKISLCYQFRVTPEDYRRLKATIENCLKGKETFHYSFIGAIFCVLRIYQPFKKKRHYFCSEFVSEQLRQMESLQLKKAARMYLPTNLAKALSQQKNLHQVLVNRV